MEWRRLEKDDYHRDYISLLKLLTDAPDITYEEFVSTFDHLSDNIYILVAVIDSTVVATGTLIFEQKFIHGGARCAHIEDVVVRTPGNGVGSELLERLVNLANGCYKITLDCSSQVIGFYEKSGFTTHGTQMVKYMRQNA